MAPERPGPITYGLLVFTPTADVTLQKVELLRPDGAHIIDASIVEVQRDAVGTWNDYPPPADELRRLGIDATTFVRADGAPLSAGSSWNLVLGLDVGEDSDAAGVEVEYTSDGTVYRYASDIALEFRPGEECGG